MYPDFKIEHLIVGPLSVNCYIVTCTQTEKTVVIDPGEEGKRILGKIKSQNGKITHIINTHGHFDHTGANAYLKEHSNAKIAIHNDDKALLPLASEHARKYELSVISSPPPDISLQDNDIISTGELNLKILHTPGHSPGGICILIESKANSDWVIFTGDTLFEGSIGRTDLPGGNFNQLISSIKSRLLPLPGETKVYPGHGGTTTMAREAKFNPFFN